MKTSLLLVSPKIHIYKTSKTSTRNRQKTNRFSKNSVERPGICPCRYKICKNLGTFIRTSQKVVGSNLQKWLVTFSEKNSNFKRSQSPKTPKNHFSKNPIKRPRICRSRYKICKNLGTFIRTSQNWVFAPFSTKHSITKKKLKISKIRKSENVEIQKSEN